MEESKEVKNCSTCYNIKKSQRGLSRCEAQNCRENSLWRPKPLDKQVPKAEEVKNCSNCVLHKDQECLSLIPCREFDKHIPTVVEPPKPLEGRNCMSKSGWEDVIVVETPVPKAEEEKTCDNCGCKNKDGDCSEVMNCSNKSNWTPKLLEAEEKPKNSFSSTECMNCSNTNARGGCDSFCNTGSCYGYSEKESVTERMEALVEQNEKSCDTCGNRLKSDCFKSDRKVEGENSSCWQAPKNTYEIQPEGIVDSPKAEETRTCSNCYNVLKSQTGRGCQEQDCAGFSHWRAEAEKNCRTCQYFSKESPHLICCSCININKWEGISPDLLSQPVKGKSHTVKILDDMIEDLLPHKQFTEDVVIGLRKYGLLYKSELRRSDGALLFGEIDYKEEVISLNNDCNSLQQKDAILHESIHGINEYNGLDLSENQITGLATNFLEFIKHNKNLIKYLMED